MSNQPQAAFEALVADIARDFESARGNVRQALNSAMVQSYSLPQRLSDSLCTINVARLSELGQCLY